MSQPVPLLVFADDWGRHPSSCQHLIKQLLDRYSVHWVNTIGTRPPKLNLETIKRGLGKFKQWSSSHDQSKENHDNLKVHHPRMWPSFSTNWSRGLNRMLMRKQLLPIIESLALAPIAITTIPIVADIMQDLPVHSWVYYCVDDFSTWPGLDGKTLGAMERDMLSHVQVIITAGEHLQERIRSMGYESKVLTHGVDVAFWQSKETHTNNAKLKLLSPPFIVFWGVIDQRMDLKFILQLADRLELDNLATVVLAGPENEPYPEVKRHKRISCIGSLPLNELPGLAHESSVLIMPYADLPVTQAMQPLKLKEYLATGKPAVVRNLPANRVWNDCLDLVDTPSEFVERVILRLKTGIPEDHLIARNRLADESLGRKADDFIKLIMQSTCWPAHHATSHRKKCS